MSSSKKLQQTLRDWTKLVTKNGAQDVTVLPSKLPNSKVAYASLGGQPTVTLVSTLDPNKNAKQMAKEIDEYSKSVRIYDSNPADSSVLGKPLGVLIRELQTIAEDYVDSTMFTVITNNDFKPLNVKLNKDQHPFDAIGSVGRKHNAELVVVNWGGWERSKKAPYERTGREVISTTVVRPDGSVFASTERLFTRKGKKITWSDRNPIEWTNGGLRPAFNPRFKTAWAVTKKAA